MRRARPPELRKVTDAVEIVDSLRLFAHWNEFARYEIKPTGEMIHSEFSK